MKRIAVFDLESDGLLDVLSRIHSLVVKTNTSILSCTDDDASYPLVARGIKELMHSDIIVGHNIIGFDNEAIKKVVGIDLWHPAKVVDTLILSRIVFPEILKWDSTKWSFIPKNLWGEHSLKAWGYRLGVYKGTFGETTDWSTWSKEMQDYCEQDVEVTAKLYDYLLTFNVPDNVIQMEMYVQYIMAWQEREGVPFDVPKAEALASEIGVVVNSIKDELQNIMPYKITKEHFVPKTNNQKTGYRKGCPLTKIKMEQFNPNSRPQIIKYLMDHGWKPENYTDKGNPQVATEEVRELGKRFPKIERLADFLEANKLYSQLATGDKAWLKYVKNGRIHGRIITNGANTFRATHSNPNLGQVPSPRAFKGKECRELFYAPDGWDIVGADASGLELRMLAHYLYPWDNGAYANIILEGDIHTHNQLGAGLATRDIAKTFIYACVTMDTEILTLEGWKKYDEVQEGDIALTYNADKECKEWQPIEEKVYYEDAEVIEMSHSHSFKVKTTPNHRWYVKQRTRSRTGNSYKRPYYTPQVRTTEEINTESNIITNAPLQDNADEFIGVNKFSLVQAKYKHDWVKEVLRMDTNSRQSFLQGFLLADGYKRSGSNQWAWSQVKGNISEALLIASYLESSGNLYIWDKGNKIGKPMMQCNIGTRGHITGQRLVKKQLANQPVWCVKTKNKTFVMRQGNTITITGNTLYGAGGAKIGKMIAEDEAEFRQEILGNEAIAKFCRSVPAYPVLKQQVAIKFKKTKHLRGLDGRQLTPRSAHSALNTLLQSAGAIVCKQWIVDTWEIIFDKGLQEYVRPALFVHDEIELLVKSEYSNEVSRIMEEAIKLSGKRLGLNMPLEAEARIGRTWYDVH